MKLVIRVNGKWFYTEGEYLALYFSEAKRFESEEEAKDKALLLIDEGFRLEDVNLMLVDKDGALLGVVC